MNKEELESRAICNWGVAKADRRQQKSPHSQDALEFDLMEIGKPLWVVEQGPTYKWRVLRKLTLLHYASSIVKDSDQKWKTSQEKN